MNHDKILVILPHPDDEAFGLSGTLAKYIEQGAQVTYACLTLGERGRNMGIPPFANRVTLPAVRQKELEASCRAIGIQDLRMLGFHDKTIEFEDPKVLDQTLLDLIHEIQPTLIFTFYPGYSVHPDHDATGAAVVRIVERLAASERPIVQCLAFSKDTKKDLGNPDVSVDIKEFLQNKLQSIRAHRSQFQAAELMGKEEMAEAELLQRFGTEKFYTYSWS
ncbi:bacillithiol biosynthesis deacetylase BshB2 [Paenibacillus shirakamiensis]|uniref:Bacillithiol biosynthesis deacetylase BshB2 n=1 Tax=Paenibacillus shirakamiensis TaxID=1265935 RepID=A0ABS4JBI7_9BACL|nr:bacillithiol biosynthesis deacetylase BshB2 [Paenibacillus shirakamiensis]MBP1999083.1 bacillithiol biosynthesis deacetylase BshB2 [Paenibacillus shirakamiensis]